VAAVTKSNVSFGLIPHEDWFQPDWIDEEKAKAGRKALAKQDIVYAGESLRRDIPCVPPDIPIPTESVSYATPSFNSKP